MAPTPSVRPQHLLLLPPPPHPTASSTLSAAYTVPLTALLKDLDTSNRKQSQGSILDIALPVTALEEHEHEPRRHFYPMVQALVAGLYKLICVIAAREGVNIEDRRGVDVRILLLAYHASAPSQTSALPARELVSPMVDLATLAQCGRPWQTVVGVEGEEGGWLLNKFLTTTKGSTGVGQNVKRVPGGVVQVEGKRGNAAAEAVADSKKTTGISDHRSVALGGTFDHIHVGHKLLLTMFAFILAESKSDRDVRCLTVGITGDELLKNKKYAELLESWDEREETTLDFLQSIMDFRPVKDAKMKIETKKEEGPNGHAVHAWLGDHTVIKCVELSDPFGPTITDEDVSALVISAETRSGGAAINVKRKEKGWAELEVFEVDVLDPTEQTDDLGEQQSFEGKLSSTTIRKALSERLEKERKRSL